MIETIEIPAELAQFRLPDGLQARLEGLVELAEFLSLLQLRARRVIQPS
jgi:hypothetical protein